jgi:hypothetical protein
MTPPPTGNATKGNAERVDPAIEMAAFDKLGPLTRKVFAESGVEVSAFHFVNQCLMKGINERALQTRDYALAKALRQQIVRIVEDTHERFYPAQMFTSDLGFGGARIKPLAVVDTSPVHTRQIRYQEFIEDMREVAKSLTVSDAIAEMRRARGQR